MHDVWAVADAYEAYVGRWSRRVAAAFVDWVAVPAGRRCVDVGCGVGALTAALLTTINPARVLGVDRSTGFLSSARTAIADPRAAFVAGDAQALPLPDRRVGAVVSGLALNFVAEPARGVAEFARIAGSGGVVAAYVWDYADGMTMLRHFWDAAIAVDPAASDFDEALRFPICQPDALRRLWQDAGLADVDTRAIDIATVFADFDDYWNPFLGGQGAAPGYVASLSSPHRDRVRDLLRARLPATADGSISLIARAWAVKGRTP
jgi:SAM-dependent methyltransferase